MQAPQMTPTSLYFVTGDEFSALFQGGDSIVMHYALCITSRVTIGIHTLVYGCVVSALTPIAIHVSCELDSMITTRRYQYKGTRDFVLRDSPKYPR